nr:acyltransferase [Aurantiacibacter rhizosphaerae]
MPGMEFLKDTEGYATQITYDMWFDQYIRGINGGGIYWPMHRSSRCINWRNVHLGIDVAPGYMPGCYIQAMGPISIGDYTRIAANVGIVSSNHSLLDARQHEISRVDIGKYCWLGINSVVLPGVTLGDYCIVAAGAVVTKSFPDGYCVLAGSPARVVRELDPDQCVHYENEHRYHGYIHEDVFQDFKSRHLNEI